MITLNNREVIGIPCYADSMKDSLVERNKAISLIDGNMEFITESNSLSRQIKIDDTFNEFGRTYKVDNIYYKAGILHIIAEVTTNQTPVEYGFKRKYTLHITDNAGNEADNAAFTWNVVSDFQVEQDIDGKEITLCVNDEKAIDGTFVLQVVVDGVVQIEMEILVRGEI